jgi:putative oxidoreductase
MFDALSRFDPLPRTEPRTRNDIVALVLRLGLGAIFIMHGLDKIDFVHGRWGTGWAERMWEARPGQLMPEALSITWVQLLVAWGELLGGVSLVLGLFTRVAVLGMVVIQVGAICLVTAAQGFFFDQAGGWEYNFVLLAALLATFVTGGGSWSLDALILRAFRGMAGRTAAGTGNRQEGPLQPV